MGRRGAGRRLNDQERMEILDLMAKEPKTKNVDLAKRYGVSEGAIRKLKQIKDTIRDRYVLGNEHNRDKRKRGGFRRNAQFEQELYEWICRMRETQAYQLIPLTQTAVRQQAMILAKNYETMATFKASPGWFARFCSRHRLDPPMAPMRDLDTIAAETEAAANASANLLAAGVGMGDVKLAAHDGNVDAPMVLAFPPSAVDAMQPIAVNVDDPMGVALAAARAAAAASAAVAAAVAVASSVSSLADATSAPSVIATPTAAALEKPSSAVDLNCHDTVVDDHNAALKAAPLTELPHDAAAAVIAPVAPVAPAPASVEVAPVAPVAVAPAPAAPAAAAAPASPKPAVVTPKVEVAPVVETKAPAPSLRSAVTDDEIFSLGL